MEPYLVHNYHLNFGYEQTGDFKNFQLLGFDILIDKKFNAWLMEVNSNPSFNMFLEKDLPNGDVERILSELDKYVKSKVVSESI